MNKRILTKVRYGKLFLGVVYNIFDMVHIPQPKISVN